MPSETRHASIPLQMHWLRVPREVEVKGLDIAQSISTGIVGKLGNNCEWDHLLFCKQFA